VVRKVSRFMPVSSFQEGHSLSPLVTFFILIHNKR